MKLRLLPLIASALLALPLPVLADVAGQPLVTLRLFVDLECPYSHQAWPLYRQALARHPDTALVLQQLPLSVHPLAMPAAIAAVAARAQGKEVAFVDALMQSKVPDEAAIRQAATTAGLDPTAFAIARADPAVAAQVTREQQAGLAMGIRTTPSALLNGRGLSGVPHPEGLQRALQTARLQAQRDVADTSPRADLERMGVLRQAPEFVPALDALRQNRAQSQPQAGQRGVLGPRWRVGLDANDLVLGPDVALTVVLFLDPSQKWQRRELAGLLRLQLQEAAAGRADIRVVVKLLVGAGREPAKASSLAFLFAGAALRIPQKAKEMLSAWGTSMTDVVFPPEDAKAADAPATSAWLQLAADLARRTEATPGAIFVNGRRWLGRADDDGLHAALAEARGEVRGQTGKPGAIYAKLVQSGRLLADVELDLAAPEPADAIPVLPVLGKIGQPVALFVDFRSPHSRAAFYMLRRLVQSKETPIRLTLAVIPHGAAPGASPSGAAILAATRMGKGLELAEALFNVDQPDTWPGIAAALKKCKLDVTTLQKAAANAETQAALQVVWRARQHLDMHDEPVIYIGERLYQGPLDESRLERGVRFVQEAPSPPAATAPGQP